MAYYQVQRGRSEAVMYTCDMILQRKMCDPSYNMQWYTIMRGKEVYVLVPVPVGMEEVQKGRVSIVLSQLNGWTLS
jgi:hypothetical protein